jgi:murein DD-endopeptidase MepM/ murein hydrolase activator NlpD
VEDCADKGRLFAENETSHVVEQGETLYAISRAYGTSLEEIERINGIVNPSQISPGQRIIIPGRATSGFFWPLEGKVSSPFGRRGLLGFHSGIDIPAPKGTAIRSAGDGLVIVSAGSLDGYSGYGKIIIIEHGDGVKTIYAHNKKNLVRAGECVRTGEIIAEVGSSGDASGSHLHFEIRKNGKPVDPLRYLPSNLATNLRNANEQITK